MNKSRSCGGKQSIFQEAIDHCRWKGVLRKAILSQPELQEHNLSQFAGKSFEDIWLYVYAICHPVEGIGMLTVYDITSAICRYNTIYIERVYIIGNGPKRAIRLLEIKAKTQKLQEITMKYVEIPEIVQAFRAKSYEIDAQIQQSQNGDDFETYICNWQKDK